MGLANGGRDNLEGTMVSSDVKHLATISVVAEPTGYSTWRSGQFDRIFKFDKFGSQAYRQAIQRAQELIREYKPDYTVEA